MKKAVALLGSRRKMNTYRMLTEIREILAQHDISLEIIELYRYDIRDCLGCEACVLRGKCVLDDDVPEIMAKIADADGIILASPVYLQQVSGKMKTFIDRTCSWYHRPVLTVRPLLSVSTTKGSGLKATLSYLENVARQWGAVPAGKIGRTIFNSKRPVSEKEMSKFIALLDDPAGYSPTLGQLIDFEVQKSLAQFLNGLDKEYWTEKGWMQSAYFYRCRVNPFKGLISGIAGRAMRRGMAKGAEREGHSGNG
jgi:multimeric flavodoxin WrbA